MLCINFTGELVSLCVCEDCSILSNMYFYLSTNTLLGYYSFSAQLPVYHGITFYASNCDINRAMSNFLFRCHFIKFTVDLIPYFC